MTITELSIKRPPLVIVIFTFLLALGFFGYSQLNYELLPDVTPPIVTVTSVYPGASPKEVETMITKEIEDAVTNVENIKKVTGWSLESVSFVVVEFNQSAESNTALQEVQRRVNETLVELPDDAETPVVSKFSINEMPILRIGAVSDLADKDFYEFMKETVKSRISRLEGVGSMALIGGAEREIQINVDKNKLESRGLSMLEILETVKRSNLDIPAGKVKDADGQYTVRLTGKIETLRTIENIVVRDIPEYGKVKIKDVAEVFDGTAETVSISRLNNKTALGIMIIAQTDANAVLVSDLVKKELAEVANEYSSTGVRFDIAQDASVFTLESADAVKFDLMMAVVLVGLVMLAFLHSIRNSIIIMVAIPCSLISTFIAMYLLGFTLNLMTLLALSLVIGILVDDSIVVLENIYRHLEMGKDKVTASIHGRNEIGFTALSITLVDVVVFLPLALLDGMVGNLVRQFAVVVVVSTMMSLFVSFTITPMLASRYSKIEDLGKNNLAGRFSAWFENIFKTLSSQYVSLLRITLNRKWVVITVSTLLMFSSFALLPAGLIGGEFLTPTDKGELQMIIELDPGAKLERTNQVTREIENQLLARPEVVKVFTNVGSSEEGFIGSYSNNVSEMIITLVPKEEREKNINELGVEYKNIAREIPGVKARVSPIMIFGSSDMAPVAVGISGPDYHDVEKVAAKIEDIFMLTPGTSDINVSSQPGKPEIQIDVDRERMAALGLSLDYVGMELRVALNGDNSAKLRDGDTEFDIRVGYDEFDKNNPNDIENFAFINAAGEKIYLKQFANVVWATGPSKLERKYRNSSITVMSRALGRASGDIGEDIKREIDKLDLPAGVNITYENDLEMQDESFGSLGLAFLAAILFVYLILAALYNSFIYPLSVLLTIPLAIIGALYGLALTMQNITIMSLLGMIILVGLVGKNAIILVDRINQNRNEGKSVTDAIMEAAKTRLRPILMTTLTLVFGVMPIALSTGAANELKTGLAVVLIGGLTSSLFLTLLLVPVMYIEIDKFKEFLLRIKSRLVKEGSGVSIKNAGKIATIAIFVLLASSGLRAQSLSLSMDEAVNIALENNRDIKIALLSNKQAGKKVTEAYGNLLPEISMEGTYVRNTKTPVFYLPSDFFGMPGGGSIPVEIGEKNVYEGYVNFQMPIYNGAIYPGIRAANLNEKINVENIRGVKSKTVTETKKAYLQVLALQQQLSLIEQSIERAGQRLNDVKNLFQQDMAADVDTLTAYIGLVNLKPVKLKLINAVENSKQALLFIMGIDENKQVILTDNFLLQADSQIDNARNNALPNRPEINSLELAVAAADEMERVEFANHLPSLNAFGRLKIEAQAGDYKFNDYNWPTSSYVGLQLSIPIFSGLKTSAKVEQAKIEKVKTIEQLDNLKEYIDLEISTSFSAMTEAKANVEARQKTVKLAERNYDMIRSRYTNGLSNLSDLLDAELMLNQAKINLITEVYNYSNAKAEYEYALGIVFAEN